MLGAPLTTDFGIESKAFIYRLYVDGDDERQDHFHGDWGERLLDWTQQHKLKVVGCREASVVLHDEGTLPLKNNEIGDEDLDEHEEDEEEDSFDRMYLLCHSCARCIMIHMIFLCIYIFTSFLHRCLINSLCDSEFHIHRVCDTLSRM